MIKRFFSVLLTVVIFLNYGISALAFERIQGAIKSTHLTIEKMIVADGSAVLDLKMSRLIESKSGILSFKAERESALTVIVANNQLRGPLPSSMKIVSESPFELPSKMGTSANQLVLEVMSFGNHYELAIRDGNTGYTFFYIEGHQYNYDLNSRLFSINEGRLILSREYANDLGRSADAGAIVGEFSSSTTMKTIDSLIDGKSESDYLTQNSEAIAGTDKFTRLFNSPSPCGANVGTIPGPDVVVGDVVGLAQFGSAVGTQVGLAVGTDSCNYGTIDLNWFRNPDNDHPVIPQNLYRMSANGDRFEQIGQGQVKHAFTALTNNLCGLGCNGVGNTRLGSGCSDPYSASLNSGPNLGSKAWINPFTGFYPRNDSATPNNNHTGHTHVGTSHRILVESNDLNTTLNPGATYFAEAQYVTPHEYAWCQTNPTQCNMNNNVSYRQYSVTGTASPFSFSPVSTTQRQKPAIYAWTGATLATIRPDAANDGVAILGYKVTNPSPGVWHYEYAVYNQNLDRAIQSFSVALPSGAVLTNVGFRNPMQHPSSAADGTAGNTGFSNTPWRQAQAASPNADSITWNSDTFASNPNANAIRWGTMYNFRYDSNLPPQAATVTIGFFKSGSPVNIQVFAPTAASTSVSGRVMNSAGQGLSNAVVLLTDSNGNSQRTVRTSSLGYYSIDDIETGGTYTIEVRSKRHTFPPRVLQINDKLTDIDFTAEP